MTGITGAQEISDVRPQSIDGLEEAGLAAAGGPAQVGPLAPPKPDIGRREEGLGCLTLMHQLKFLQCQTEGFVLSAESEFAHRPRQLCYSPYR